MSFDKKTLNLRSRTTRGYVGRTVGMVMSRVYVNPLT